MSRRLYPILALWPLLAMLCGLGSCTKEIDIRPQTEVQVVASCVLANADVQRLKLTYSREMGGGRFYDEVEQARATLYEEGTAVGSFVRVGYGTWELRFRPTAGRHYRLEVEVPQRPTLRATTQMPSPVDVRRRALRSATTRLFTQRTLGAPYWMFCLSSSLKEVPRDPLHPPKLTEDPNPRLCQQLGTNHRRADHFNEESELAAWDQSYGAVALYRYYTRITPPGDDPTGGTPYEFVVQHAPSRASFVVFRAASQEYDRYLRSVVEKMIFYESEDDPAAWFDQTTIYSNIEHGLGIFAAYYQTAYYCHESLP